MTTERIMPIGTTITIGAACLLAGAGLGFGFARGIDRPDSAETVEAVAAPIEAGGKAAAETLDAALAVEQTKADAQLALATMPASRVLAEAVVAERCAPLTGALAAYSIAVAGSQGKEGSASVNAEEAQQDVARVLVALVESPDLCPRRREDPPAPVEAPVP